LNFALTENYFFIKVSVPHLVPLEFQSSRMEYKDEQELQEWEHPVTGHRHRYVVGDRFHSSTNRLYADFMTWIYVNRRMPLRRVIRRAKTIEKIFYALGAP
jgi:hypothetical protein